MRDSLYASRDLKQMFLGLQTTQTYSPSHKSMWYQFHQ